MASILSDNAPVTRYIIVVSFLTSILASWSGLAPVIQLSYSTINVWTFLATIFVFKSTPEFIVSLTLLSSLKFFEQQFGSRKYGAFVIFTLVVSRTIQTALLLVLKSSSLTLRPGLYDLIFSLFVLYFYEVPAISTLKIYSITVNNKVYPLIFIIPLLFSSFLSTIIVGLSGAAAGLLYRWNIGGIRSAQVPDSLPRAVTSFIASLNGLFKRRLPQQEQQPLNPNPQVTPLQSHAPLSSTRSERPPETASPFQMPLFPHQNPPASEASSLFSPPAAPFGSVSPQLGFTPAPLDRLFASGAAPSSSGAPSGSASASMAFASASRDEVEELVAMGFERSKVLWALSVCSNNVAAACDLLLSSD